MCTTKYIFTFISNFTRIRFAASQHLLTLLLGNFRYNKMIV